MNEQLVELLQTYKPYAIFISVMINVIISVLGIIPSLFITATNLVIFGFWKGTLISFIGEGIGAVVSFILYRKGLRSIKETRIFQHPMIKKLLEVEGKDAFMLVFLLRLLPFVPSGAITFLAAIGRMTIGVFVISSTLGKLPSIVLEAYSVNHIIKWTWQGKTIITIFIGVILISVLNKIYKKN